MNDLSDASLKPPGQAAPRVGLAPGMRSLPQGLVFFFGDLLIALLIYWAVNAYLQLIGNTLLSRSYVLLWLGIWLLLRAYQGLYPGYGRAPHTELRLHTVGTVQTAFAQFAVTYAVHDFDRSRLGLGLLWLLVYLLALPARYLLRALMIRLKVFGRPVAIVGAGKTGELAVQYLRRHPAYGLRPVAIYDDNPDLLGQRLYGVPVLGGIAEALSRPRALQAIISIPGARADVQRDIINAVHAVYPITWATPDFFGVPNQALVPHTLGTHATLEVRNNLRSRRSRLTKWLIDSLGGALIFVLILPLLLLIAVVVKLDNPGPALYRARRLGRGGQFFGCYKFRTMQQGADAKLEALLARDPERRAEFEATHKLRDDPRVTRIGAFLRRTSLDELPQLLNVLRGEMSLVGPRPIVQAEIPKYGDIYRLYTQVRPGITGYWQVSGRSDTSYEERVDMDNFYVSNWTPWLDCVILIQTVRVVALGKGAY